MPIGSFINVLPPTVFVVIHLALLALGVALAYRCFAAEARDFGWGFALYAAAEVFYLTYHLDWTVILFAHTVAEVLDAAAFVTLFAAGMRRIGGVAQPAAGSRAHAPMV